VQFRDLGLLVVDEEQRFGVTHKERLKQMRKKVDVLTMTATPIPRTLNMSLVGIRDMSVIETPPRDRLSIQTHVLKFDSDVIGKAIRTEMERGGQVFLVHNRVESIHSIANLVTRLVPEAKLAVGHGQMAEDALEKVMIDFMSHKYDVLVATTIVENGLDIPNANTIIVNRADRYGLAQLYQLRGRVGRSDRRAYAYLLIPPDQTLSPIARRRLAAIREFSDLGSGFRVAALDLEIRGAGNLLGGEQSGHIEAVGFDVYMKLLEETIRELKGEDLEDERRAGVNLRLDLRIDDDYIPDMNQRLSAYRRMASVRRLEEVDALLEELAIGMASAAFGQSPGAVRAHQAGVRSHRSRKPGSRGPARRAQVPAGRQAGPRHDPESRSVAGRSHAAPAGGHSPGSDGRSAAAPCAGGQGDSGKRAPGRPARPGRKPAAGVPSLCATKAPGGSWWTARAGSTVQPGFTKGEILAEAPFDPSTPGGLFERLGSLLEQLTQSLVASSEDGRLKY
jgi:transcription-repair coupling factor (superfamily II helicase)